MFKTREEELLLRELRRQQLLKMFRATLTEVSNLKQRTLQVNVSALFQVGQFSFDITVFSSVGDNKSLTIYDFWEVKESQKLIYTFLTAVKSGVFEKVKEVKCSP